MSDTERAEIENAMPQYQRLKAHVSGSIDAGLLKPGQRIPSELELSKTFSVSRMTVSRALNELEKEGAISRVQGVGSFVAQRKTESAVLEIRNIAEEIRARGQAYSCKPVRVGRSKLVSVNSLLGLSSSTVHYRTILIHHADNSPVQIEDRYVNPNFAPKYIDQDFSRITPNQYLMSLATLQAAEHVFEAHAPSANEARWLNIDPRCPCIVLRRRTWSLNIVASFAVMTAPSSRYRYKGAFGTLPPLAKTLPPL